MSGAHGGTWSPQQGGHNRAVTWENIYDDGSRWEQLPYRGELMRLDECGPSPETIGYVP